jgi:uncharacterized protein with ParB-like and HNH nuclease domain
MKFSDIKYFTSQGHDQENVSLCRLLPFLKSLKEDFAVDLKPDFQREHVWTKEQQIAYLEYRLKGGRSGDTIYFNRYKNNFLLVDGLQRLSAIKAFFDNEIPVFGCLCKDFEDDLKRTESNCNFTLIYNNLKKSLIKLLHRVFLLYLNRNK